MLLGRYKSGSQIRSQELVPAFMLISGSSLRLLTVVIRTWSLSVKNMSLDMWSLTKSFWALLHCFTSKPKRVLHCIVCASNIQVKIIHRVLCPLWRILLADPQQNVLQVLMAMSMDQVLLTAVGVWSDNESINVGVALLAFTAWVPSIWKGHSFAGSSIAMRQVR